MRRCLSRQKQRSRTAIIFMLIIVIVAVIFFIQQYNLENKEILSDQKHRFEAVYDEYTDYEVENKDPVFKNEDVLFKSNLAVKSTAKSTEIFVKPKSVYFNFLPLPCYSVHIFYYPWYGNPSKDGKYIHWNHKYLPHWSPEIAKMYPSGIHKPPLDIGSNFYPLLGPYSSKDPQIIKDHMEQIHLAKIGVLVVSYYPQGMGDDNGEDWQSLLPILLENADKYKLKVAFHIEPYKGRSEVTVKGDIKYIIDTYGSHNAFYSLYRNGKNLPVIYIYDSYHTKPEGWMQLLLFDGELTIRATNYDCFVIGLVVEEKHKHDILKAGFDGFYTYFAANGFTYGSTRGNWNQLKEFADKNQLIFIPSVGPGYIDTRVRPWNNKNTRNRFRGKYYAESWNTALKFRPELMSITSFNEWHEGTQIEKAIPQTDGEYKYLDYSPAKPDYYLTLTRKHIETFFKCSNKN